MQAKNYKRYLITSALPYANGPVHIGHLAGVYVPSDVYTRYLRLKGRDVIHVCGSDEHGVPITIKARQLGITPQQVVDKYHEIIKTSFEQFGISFDIYSRTSSAIHHKTASDFFKKLYDDGKFIEKKSEQYYDEEAKQFLADRYITGTCPKCGNENAYGDQCEKCGSTLSPTELISPRSTISGSKPVMRETSHWYLPLDRYEDWLREWILKGHRDWKTNVYGQCKSWIDGGLQPRAVSRDLDWGVKVPVEGAEGKVLYVWFDAPIGYLSNTIELIPNEWEKYWKDEGTKMVHFIGKDNIVFHCIVFPAMLKAHGEFILPDNIPANEFLNLENDKISTSRNWAVWLHEYLEEFPNKQDVMRYVLTANAPEAKDNNFTWKDFQDRNNNELVAILGNFVNRTLVLTHKYFEGKVPPPDELTDFDHVAIAEMKGVKCKVEENLESYRFREALREVMNLARLGNKYLADTEPWKFIKTDGIRVRTILNVALQITANLAIAMEPFMPFTAPKLRQMLNASDVMLQWDSLGCATLMPIGHQLGEAALLFEKVEDETVEYQLQKLQRVKEENLHREAISNAKVPEVLPVCSFDDFQKMDIRIVTILEAEKVAKSKKLVKMLVDTGLDKRTVVSGVAEYFNPEELVGKQVPMLINLAPRPIMGIESQGMILYAEDATGRLNLIQPKNDVNNSSKVC
ncbi:MAG: methionine--tRNA ligase [Prevotellaceae bacterium]|jgi:methionyl-tRNA synthetase|nr:methionine--tRNA ligase [Prevotellaceae bacterium]